MDDTVTSIEGTLIRQRALFEEIILAAAEAKVSVHFSISIDGRPLDERLAENAASE